MIATVLFPTVGFGIFLPLVFLGAWLLHAWPDRWRAFLLLASLVFFGWADWRACAALAAIIAVTHLAAHRVNQGGQASATGWLALLAVVLVGTFAIVGRADIGRSAFGVMVPLALGLLVLRCLGYVLDVHRGAVAPAPLVHAALALCFFPLVLAGPLPRMDELLPQFAAAPDPRRIEAVRAFRGLVVGLFLLVVIGPYLSAHLVTPVIASPSDHSALEVLFAMYGASVELFAELAGYAVMAIGVGLLLGIELPDNFDAPFAAGTLRAFWRRWTTTFSAWFRDYVYGPLGGGRGAVAVRNVMITFVLAGFWFIGGWTGLVWGLGMGIALAVERAVVGDRARSTASAVVGWIVTFNVVAFGWLVVRAGDLSTVGELLGRLAHWGPSPLVTPLVVIVIAGMVAVQFLPERLGTLADAAVSRLPLAGQAVAVAAALLLIDSLGQGLLAPAVPARF